MYYSKSFLRFVQWRSALSALPKPKSHHPTAVEAFAVVMEEGGNGKKNHPILI
jgi:hypothetical protein